MNTLLWFVTRLVKSISALSGDFYIILPKYIILYYLNMIFAHKSPFLSPLMFRFIALTFSKTLPKNLKDPEHRKKILLGKKLK